MKRHRVTAALLAGAAAAVLATAGTAAAATSHPAVPASRAVPAAHAPRDTWTAYYDSAATVTWGSQRQAPNRQAAGSLPDGITVA